MYFLKYVFLKSIEILGREVEELLFVVVEFIN